MQFEFTTDTGILTFTNLHDFVRFLIDKRGLSNFETIQDLVQKAMRTKKREVNILREDRPMKTLGHADTKKDPSLSSLKCEIHNYAAFCMKNDYFALDTTHNISLFDILPSETEASTNPSSAKKNNNEAKHAEEPMPIKTDIELTHSLQKLLFEKKDNDPNDQTQPPQINDGLLSETKPELSEIVRTPEKPISLFPKFVSKPSNSLASNIQKLHPGQVISRKIDISESHTNPTQELMKKKRGAIKNLPEPKPLEQLIAEKQNREELPANSMSNHKPTYVSSKAKEKKKKIAKRKPEPGPPTDEHKEILQQSVQDETSAKKEEDDSFERKIALMENLNRNSGLFNSVALRNIN